MQRITQKDLNELVTKINSITCNPQQLYMRTGEKHVANAGNYHLSYAYGGVALEQMCEGGGVRRISTGGYGTKRELYNWMQSFISGHYVKEREQQKNEMTGGGFVNMTVRFFIYDDEIENEHDDTTGDIREASEDEFIACEYPIEYERNTVFANGVKQICLTKMPRG